MEQNFFTLVKLPARMKKLGNNIEHLYHTACRTVVNAELVEHKVDGIYVQFGADEHNQIVVTFVNKLGAESERFVIKARKLVKVVDSINEVYNRLIKKGFTTMRKKDKKTVAETTVVSNEVSNATTVVSDTRSDSTEVDVLVEFTLQHYAHSGIFYELEKFVNVPQLCQEKSCGAVSNVIFNGDNIAFEGANKVCISFNVAGMDQSVLREQVIWALQTVVERNKQLPEQKASSTEHLEPATEDKVEVKEKIKSVTKVKPFRGKVCEKAVERFNEAVGKGVDALEPILKGRSPSASSQSIRYYLKKSAYNSRLRLPDTSGETLVKNLSQYNVELLYTLCASADCKIPPFLQKKDATVASSSKSLMRA